jgi:hypothetical protein
MNVTLHHNRAAMVLSARFRRSNQRRSQERSGKEDGEELFHWGFLVLNTSGT